MFYRTRSRDHVIEVSLYVLWELGTDCGSPQQAALGPAPMITGMLLRVGFNKNKLNHHGSNNAVARNLAKRTK